MSSSPESKDKPQELVIRIGGTGVALLDRLKCPKESCKFQGGFLYLKLFPRRTRHGLKLHRYWVIAHDKPNEPGTITHYVGKKLPKQLRKFKRSGRTHRSTSGATSKRTFPRRGRIKKLRNKHPIHVTHGSRQDQRRRRRIR
jgi:hypothetical protein